MSIRVLLLSALLGASLGAVAPAAHARDTIVNITLESVLEMPEAKKSLDGSVRFFLAGAPTPAVERRLGSDVSNKKTSGVGKTDEFGCRWAALAALEAFQKQARAQGANAVVDLVSYYKKNETRDPHTIQCHAGGVVIGVALKGEYAKVK
jgi:hypothetical protein